MKNRRKGKGSRHRGWTFYLDALIGDEEQKKRKHNNDRILLHKHLMINISGKFFDFPASKKENR